MNNGLFDDWSIILFDSDYSDVLQNNQIRTKYRAEKKYFKSQANINIQKLY